MTAHYTDKIVSVDPFTASKQHYDILLIGSGILGSTLARSLALSGRSVLLLERDLSLPDRIVGELLQPGGCVALEKMGLAHCLEGIDATKVDGYEVFWGGDRVEIPYPDESISMRWSQSTPTLALDDDDDKENSNDAAGMQVDKSQGGRKQEGRSFHHGRFVMNLRRAASTTAGVTLVEGTANDLIKNPTTGHITGITVTPRSSSSSSQEQLSFSADLTLVTDGCFSKFRRDLLPSHVAPVVRSNFVGLLLEDADLPSPHHGHVILRKSTTTSSSSSPAAPRVDSKSRSSPGNVGPVLIYQLSTHETRMLIDVPGARVPSVGNGDLARYLLKHVTPVLPPSVIPSFLAAIAKADPSYIAPALEEKKKKEEEEDGHATKHDYRLRSMPNSYLPAYPQGRSTPGVILAGDSMNMRHPLTGGGMSVALNDCLLLTELLGGGNQVGQIVGDRRGVLQLDGEWDEVKKRLEEWHWRRKGLSSTINVLAQALYSLFGADDEHLEVLKTGCFKYFELGGECVGGPVSLLSALKPSPMLLIYHFFSVALYSIYILFTTPVHRHPISSTSSPSPSSSSSSASDTEEEEEKEGSEKSEMEDVLLPPSFVQYPALTLKSARVFWTALVVLAPVLWNEGQM